MIFWTLVTALRLQSGTATADSSSAWNINIKVPSCKNSSKVVSSTGLSAPIELSFSNNGMSKASVFEYVPGDIKYQGKDYEMSTIRIRDTRKKGKLSSLYAVFSKASNNKYRGRQSPPCFYLAIGKIIKGSSEIIDDDIKTTFCLSFRELWKFLAFESPSRSVHNVRIICKYIAKTLIWKQDEDLRLYLKYV